MISADIQDSTSDSYDDFGTLVATFHDADVHQVLLFGVTDALFEKPRWEINRSGRVLTSQRLRTH
jgi:hypothetical protein